MARSEARAWLFACALVACGGDKENPSGAGDAGTSPAADAAAPDAAPSDAGGGPDDAAAPVEAGAAPAWTTAQKSELAKLRYDASAPPADVSNKYADDPGARLLGQRLFFDPSLSGQLIERDNDGSASTLGLAGQSGRVSCAGCHVASSGFVDTRSPHRQISLAAQWTRRRTPTLLDVAFAPLYNWDGRRDALWNQAIGVFESAAEFNSGRLFIAEQVYRNLRAEYEAVFGTMPNLADTNTYPPIAPEEAGCNNASSSAVCRGKPGDNGPYDGMSSQAQAAVTTVTVNVAKALSAYVRLLRCGTSRFDDWLSGDESALTASEQRGAALFIGEGKCVTCHSGPNLTDHKFHNVGLRPGIVAVAFTDTGDRGAAEGIAAAQGDPLGSSGAFGDGDRGKLPAKVTPEMEGAFRTPGLRCIADHPSFMHTGQMTSLEQVVRFHVRGGDSAGYPGTNELKPLALTDADQADLVAFLKALEGPGPSADLLAAPAR